MEYVGVVVVGVVVIGVVVDVVGGIGVVVLTDLPDPLSLIERVSPVKGSRKVKVPARVPVEVGVKVKVMVQV